ncbi:MAG: hypothetical protein ACOYXT_06125 [Bacteroidota bacterium]
MKHKVYPIFIFVLTLCEIGSAQDLGNLKNAKAVDFSGALSLRLNAYSTNRENSVRDPFFWTVTGSPTLSIYGVTLPFYFSFSQKNQDYRQPFNQFGLSPYYKWLRLHLGYRNISFSDFTLSNHTFLGAGVEAEPGIFRFGFVYGRFLKAINQPIDTLTSGIITPTFARKGVAAKIGIGTYNNYVDLIFFKGKDDSTSVDAPMEVTGIRPAENLVYGVKARQAFLKMFYFDLDYGFSIYTSDMTAAEINTEDYKVPAIVSALIAPRTSTTFLMAGKASLSMRISILSLRLQYTRVEPDYQSMGSYFLNNDYENITLAPSWNMLKNKVRISGSVGIQRNNIFSDKINTTNRQINSINVTVMPNPKWSMNAFYTNYRINQERNIRLTLDTLKLEQFSDNLNINSILTMGTKEIRHTVTGGFNYQVFRDDNNISEANNETSSVNPMLAYRFQNTPSKFGAHASINVNAFATDLNKTLRWAYTLGANKSFFDNQLTLNGSATYFNIKVDGAAQSNAVSFNGRVGYRIKEQHQLDLSMSLVNRKQLNVENGDFRDVLGNFGYTYNFGRK